MIEGEDGVIMKKTRKRIFGLLMAGLMICLPAMQALAQTYSAGWLDPAPVLFPGDVLTDIAVPVTLDGEAVALGEEVPATWTNDSEGKVYSTLTAEDGSIALTLVGYELDVTGGTSEVADVTADTTVGGHYVPAADEIVDENAPKTDRAYYPAYTFVKIKAAEPEEGMEFDKWTVEPEDVILEDALNSETTLTVPEKKISITANYRPVQNEQAGVDPSAEGTPEDVIDPNAGGTPGEIIDPNAEGVPGDMIDPNAGGTSGEVIDPNAEGVPGDMIDPNASGTSGEVIDPNAEGTPEEVIDLNAGTPGDTVDQSIGGQDTVTIPGDMNNSGPVVTIPENTDDQNGSSVPENTDGQDGTQGENTIDFGDTDAPENSGELDMGNMEAGENGTDTMMPGDPSAIIVTTGDSYNSNENNGQDEIDAGVDGTAPAEIDLGDDIASYSLNVHYGIAVGEGLTVVEENGEGVGTSYSIPVGTTVTVTANDYSVNGYYFSYWNVESGNTVLTPADNSVSASFAMPEGNVEITANYADVAGTPVADPAVVPTQTYSLTVNSGTATVDGAEITLPTEIKEGTMVTITAVDNTTEGYQFTGWTASAPDENGTEMPIDVAATIDSNDPLTAVFEMPGTDVMLTAAYEPMSYTVTVYGGEILSSDGTAAPAAYEAGDRIQIQANAAAGQTFKEWTANAGVFDDPASPATWFTMPTANVILTANFTQDETESAPSVDPNANGSSPIAEEQKYKLDVVNGVITAPDASGSYAEGTVVTLQANAPAEGMKFSKWTAVTGNGDAVAESAFKAVNKSTTNFTVPASNVTVKAEYGKIKHKVVVNDGAADYKKAAEGTKVTITANEAPEGMEFDYWRVDSGNVSLKDAYSATTTFTMPLSRVEVSAYYRMKDYQVIVQNGRADNATYQMGQEVTIYSNYPSSGREFDQWQAVSGKISFADSSRWKTTFTMPASDVTVSAAYKDGPSPNNNQILDLVAGGEYITNNTIKFTAAGAGMDNSNPNPGDYRYRPTGYQIGNVTGSWQSSPYTTTMSIKARGDYTLKVNYAKDVFDGTNWNPDGTTDTRSVTFRVLTPAEAVKTGDETPIAMMVILAGASCLLFLLLVSVLVRRKKNS